MPMPSPDTVERRLPDQRAILLVAADRALYALHTAVMLFCLLGWIVPQTRLAQFVLVIGIGLSWVLIAPFKGLGYCLLTDLQWRVKRALGEGPLPASFVKYQLDRLTGLNWNPTLVEVLDYVGLFVSAGAAIAVNFL